MNYHKVIKFNRLDLKKIFFMVHAYKYMATSVNEYICVQTWWGVYIGGSGCQFSGSLWDVGRFTPLSNERHLHTLITSALSLK